MLVRPRRCDYEAIQYDGRNHEAILPLDRRLSAEKARHRMYLRTLDRSGTRWLPEKAVEIKPGDWILAPPPPSRGVRVVTEADFVEWFEPVPSKQLMAEFEADHAGEDAARDALRRRPGRPRKDATGTTPAAG